MCSNPTTTIDKFTGAEVTFACRRCDDCISTRKNEWVARCMAEYQTAAHTLVLSLTYRNKPDGTLPPAARAFRYADVQRFLKLLRYHAGKTYGKTFELRYIVAGERGSQTDRVHWHLVLFASHDISALGTWTTFDGEPLPGPRLKANHPGNPMDHWTFWPHGHIVSDEASQRSIAYCLKYALKDMFNVVKSKGTARIAKAENDGAGMFRMSKQPPIGVRFVADKLARLMDPLSVPPSSEINVPGYSGYWWPRGPIREWYLTTLREINLAHREKYGKDAPAWTTLIASLSEIQKDLEILHGLQTQETFDEEQFKEDLNRQSRERASRDRFRRERDTCGSRSLCALCFNSLSETQKADLEDWRNVQLQQALLHPRRHGESDLDLAERIFRQERRPNPYCQRGDDKEQFFRSTAYL